MPAAGAARTIREMALPAAGPLGLISGAGSGCTWVRCSGTGAEREKEEGKGEGREVGAVAGVGVSSSWMGPSCLCRWSLNYEMGGEMSA